jgi:hypothetical protein
MGSKNQTTKSVCLNHNNELDKKILRHVSRRNFSGYVKKLILAEINKSLEKKQTGLKQEPINQEPETHKKKVEEPKKKNVASRSASVPSRNHAPVSSSIPLIKTNKQN